MRKAKILRKACSVLLLSTLFFSIAQPCFAWCNKVHKGIALEAYYYMNNTTQATENQKKAAQSMSKNWQVNFLGKPLNMAWGTVTQPIKPWEIVAKGVVDIDHLDNLCFDNDEDDWWKLFGAFHKHYTGVDTTIDLGFYEFKLDANYTSFMHFLDLPSKVANWSHKAHDDTDKKGGIHNDIDGYNYIRHEKVFPGSFADVDDAVDTWMGDDDFCIKHSGFLLDWYEKQQGAKDEWGNSISSKNHSCYTRWDNDHKYIIYAPIDNLSRFWSLQAINFWNNPNGAYYMGYALHAAGDVSQMHHVFNTLGWGHSNFEAWADYWFDNRKSVWFNKDKVKEELETLYTVDGVQPHKRTVRWLLQKLAYETFEYTLAHPELWDKDTDKKKFDTAYDNYMKEIYPKAVACSVAMMERCYYLAEK